MEDLLILVDENDNPVGECPKMKAHVEKLLHRAFSVFFYDRKEEKMLIQRRAEGKYHSGGKWSNSCCSHPRVGETLTEAVPRRVKEELGVEIAAENLVYCGKFHYFAQFAEVAEHEVDNVFLYEYDYKERDKIIADPSEADALLWISKEELDAWLKREPEAFSAWFLKAYAFIDQKLGEMEAC